MGETKQRYVIRLEAEGGERVKATLETVGEAGDRSFKKISDGATRMDMVMRAKLSAMASSIFNLRSAIATLAGSAGIGLLVKQSIEYADTLGKTANNLGLTTTQLQEYRGAAQIAGITQEEFDQAFNKFNVTLGKAIQGNKEAATTLERLGVNIESVRNGSLSSSDAFRVVSDGLASVSTVAERSALLTAIFGREIGPRMAEFLKIGSAGMNAYAADARAFGLVIEESLIRKAEQAGDQIDLLAAIIKTNFTAGLLDGFIEEFTDVAELMRDPSIAQGMRDLGELTGQLARAGIVASAEIGTLGKVIFDTTQGTMALADTTGALEKVAFIAAKGMSAAWHSLEAGVWGAAAAVTKAVDFTVNNTIAAMNKLPGVNIQKMGALTDLSDAYGAAALDAGKKVANDLDFNAKSPAGTAIDATLGQARANLETVGTSKQAVEAQHASAAATDATRQTVDHLTSSTGGLRREIYNMGRESARSLSTLARSTDDATDSFSELSSAASSALGQLASNYASGGKFDFKRTIISTGLNALQAYLDRNTGGGLENLNFSQFGSSIFGQFGRRASGGPVEPGRSYLVGEQGPEILRMGNQGGNVVPNHAISAQSAGMNVYIDAKGADSEGLARVENAIRTLGGKIHAMDSSFEGRAAAAIANQRKRSNVYLR